jgi:cystathionine gamma-synthase
MSPEALATAGISDGLIRLSIGLEDAQDLVAALERGLNQL